MRIAAALFSTTGGPTAFATVASTITAIGIVAGLIGTDFVLVMLVLAARIPLIDRTIGHDRAMAVHRRLGKPALYLLLAHGALLLIGYGTSQGIDPISEIGPMLALPDMPLACSAMGLMVAVVITSLVAVRRGSATRAGTSSTCSATLPSLTALPHQLSAAACSREGTVQRVYWIALYVVASARS